MVLNVCNLPLVPSAVERPFALEKSVIDLVKTAVEVCWHDDFLQTVEVLLEEFGESIKVEI